MTLPPDWTETVEALRSRPGIVVILGGSDRGKTTWMRSAAARLTSDGPVAVVDADIGQSTIGPPATVALSLVRHQDDLGQGFATLSHHALAFVGSTSPIGHLLQTVVAAHRLIRKAAQTEARHVLVDTTGLIDGGVGFSLKLSKIEALRPGHLVALQRTGELEPLLSVVAHRPGMTVHRLSAATTTGNRSPAERAAYRAKRWAAYFAGAGTHKLRSERLCILPPPTGRHPFKPTPKTPLLSGRDLTSVETDRLVVGLNDVSNETLAVGILEGVAEDGSLLSIRAPLPDVADVQILQLGSLRLDEGWTTRAVHPRFSRT